MSGSIDSDAGHPVRKTAVIAGAGPAGLTSALELLDRSDVVPLIFESEGQVGGISKTVNHRGNRMDLGGHRFFSKSDWVMRWWQKILPVARDGAGDGTELRVHYQGRSRGLTPTAGAPSSADAVMLVRERLSRIYYRRRFFDYPLKLNANTLGNLGVAEILRVGSSYARARIAQRHPELTLEDFLVNRFGERLYRTFFKDYTEKVWGVPCREISAEWGAQRIKGLSVTKAIAHAVASRFRSSSDTAQKGTETSLIERFLYPKLGPGQMWEEVARRVRERGGALHLRHSVVGIERRETKITAVTVRDHDTREERRVPCDFLVSSMPVRTLVELLRPDDPVVAGIAAGLPYRDFMTAGLLLRQMAPLMGRRRASANGMPPDNWIYIQEPDVRIGRLQIFNNWSPALVADPGTIWLGLEYFCSEGDDLWSKRDPDFIDFAARELERIGMIRREDVLEGTVVRVPKAYPAYFGTYPKFAGIRSYLDGFGNLYPIGRNGMHRYNNQDHSMLAAKYAVDSIVDRDADKAAIWDVNVEDDYHEEIDSAA